MLTSKFEIKGTIATTVTVPDLEMGNALLRRAQQLTHVEDDGGNEWVTDALGNTYIGDESWCVSSEPAIAVLVDAAHVLSGRGIIRACKPEPAKPEPPK